MARAMTEMTNDAKRELGHLVEDWGYVFVLRALAGFAGHWSRIYDQSRATDGYASAEVQLNALADYLEGISNVS